MFPLLFEWYSSRLLCNLFLLSLRPFHRSSGRTLCRPCKHCAQSVWGTLTNACRCLLCPLSLSLARARGGLGPVTQHVDVLTFQHLSQDGFLSTSFVGMSFNAPEEDTVYGRDLIDASAAAADSDVVLTFCVPFPIKRRPCPVDSHFVSLCVMGLGVWGLNRTKIRTPWMVQGQSRGPTWHRYRPFLFFLRVHQLARRVTLVLIPWFSYSNPHTGGVQQHC